MARKNRVGARAPETVPPDLVFRRKRGTPLAFVRAGTARGRAFLLSQTTAEEGDGERGPLASLGGEWPIEPSDVTPLARAAIGAGLMLGEAPWERAP